MYSKIFPPVSARLSETGTRAISAVCVSISPIPFNLTIHHPCPIRDNFSIFTYMSEKYKFDDPEGTYFVTMSVVFWIDLFTRKELKYVIVDALKYCQQEKGLIINACVY